MNDRTIDYTPVAVYLPAADDPLNAVIRPRSGIVGTPADDDRLVLDYADRPVGGTWADRLHIAWGRHLRQDGHRYPTIARSTVAAHQATVIATYDPREGDVALDPQSAALAARWLDVDEDSLEHELHAHSARHDQRREIRAALAGGTHDRQAIAQYARRYGHDDLLDEPSGSGR